MRLVPGQRAPAFEANNWNGDAITLPKAGKVWLAFFRYASCPLCNLRVRAMITGHDALTQKGLAVLSVFQSPGEKISEYVFEAPPPFPMISDPGLGLYGEYGVERKKRGFVSLRNATRFAKATAAGLGGFSPDGPMDRIPADFLIEDGIIVDSFYGAAISDHIPMDRVEAFLA